MPNELPYDVDADMPSPAAVGAFEAAIFDDGHCPRTKLSICPGSPPGAPRMFVNRCTKDAFHKSGCAFVTERQPEGPMQRELFRR